MRIPHSSCGRPWTSTPGSRPSSPLSWGLALALAWLLVGCGDVVPEEGSLAQELKGDCTGMVLAGTPVAGSITAGTSVSLTVSGATCTNSPIEYVFRRGFGGTWTTIRAWGTSPSATWSTTGAANGTYSLFAWVRSAGAASPWDATNTLVYTITGGATACTPGTTQSCTTTCGSTGTQTCASTSTWGPCVPPMETCNGVDDNCDGLIDVGFRYDKAYTDSLSAEVPMTSYKTVPALMPPAPGATLGVDFNEYEAIYGPGTNFSPPTGTPWWIKAGPAACSHFSALDLYYLGTQQVYSTFAPGFDWDAPGVVPPVLPADQPSHFGFLKMGTLHSPSSTWPGLVGCDHYGCRYVALRGYGNLDGTTNRFLGWKVGQTGETFPMIKAIHVQAHTTTSLVYLMEIGHEDSSSISLHQGFAAAACVRVTPSATSNLVADVELLVYPRQTIPVQTLSIFPLASMAWKPTQADAAAGDYNADADKVVYTVNSGTVQTLAITNPMSETSLAGTTGQYLTKVGLGLSSYARKPSANTSSACYYSRPDITVKPDTATAQAFQWFIKAVATTYEGEDNVVVGSRNLSAINPATSAATGHRFSAKIYAWSPVSMATCP